MASVRGKAACDGCRSRKQKCDETKPVCSRCRGLNRPCIWPRSQKRGPVKGYIEALEHRLEETENALLQVLSIMDNDTLELAFQNDTVSRRGALRLPFAASPDTSSSAEATKSGLVTHWRDYPLQTASDVRQWAKEALDGESDTSTHIPPERGSNSFVRPPATPQYSFNAMSTPTSVNDGGSTNTFVDDSEIQVSGTISGQTWDETPHLHQQPEVFSGSVYMSTPSQPGQQSERTDNVMGISEDFRKQYIW